MKNNKQNIYFLFGTRFFLFFSAIIIALFFFEIFLRVTYSNGIYGEKDSYYPFGPGATLSGNPTFDTIYFFGEKINFRSFFNYQKILTQVNLKTYSFEEEVQKKLINNSPLRNVNFYLNISKINIAIIGDSIAEGHHGSMESFRFSKILSDIGLDKNFYNFATGGHNIAEIFAQYYKYIKGNSFKTIVYVYYNNDIYFNKIIDGKLYYSPIILESGDDNKEILIKVTDISSLDSFLSKLFFVKYIYNKTLSHTKGNFQSVFKPLDEKYFDFLKKRFLKFASFIKEDSKKEGTRFIIIISPHKYNDKKLEYLRIAKEDNEIFQNLKNNGFEVYSLYDLDFQKKDIFVDECCHLNQKGHKMYADFIFSLLNK